MATNMRGRVWRNAMVAAMNESLVQRVEGGWVSFKLFGLDATAHVGKPVLEQHVAVEIPGRLSAQGWFERDEGFWLQSGMRITSHYLKCSKDDVTDFARWPLIETMGYRDSGKVMR